MLVTTFQRNTCLAHMIPSSVAALSMSLSLTSRIVSLESILMGFSLSLSSNFTICLEFQPIGSWRAPLKLAILLHTIQIIAQAES
jgi:hypothetical protein